MLQPDERALLLDALRPPEGMAFDYAVATTFSLDLEALLLAPVAFALFDASASESGSGPDPVALLEAVRRHAGNIDLFCQTGQVALPTTYRPLTAYLEDTVHPCTVRRRHRIFHPKLWLLRFAEGDNRAYRLLVLSRNLTFSRSWDTVVRLEGQPRIPTIDPAPLVRFLNALPELAVADHDRFSRVTELANEVDNVAWELPAGFDRGAFLAFGLGDATALPPHRRLLAMAPFASASRVATLASSSTGNVLVSRSETLDRIDGDILAQYDEVYTLSPSAVDPDTEATRLSTEELAERPDHDLVGLHAKLYVAQDGSQATLITGSPNATDAAFDGNVEFAVALSGPTCHVGIDRLLNGDDATNNETTTLLQMLEPYHRHGEVAEPTEEERIALRLEELGRRLAEIAFTLDSDADDDVFALSLTADRPLPDLGGASLIVYPISTPAAAVELEANRPVETRFTGLSLYSVTSFLCLELSEPTKDEVVSTRLVVNARLVGMPEDRHQRILTASLQSPADVLRYLLFLLTDVNDPAAVAELARFIASGDAAQGDRAPDLPLFESMVRALRHRPESLDHVDRLVVDLSRTPEGRKLLPKGLEEIWPAVRRARQEIAS